MDKDFHLRNRYLAFAAGVLLEAWFPVTGVTVMMCLGAVVVIISWRNLKHK